MAEFERTFTVFAGADAAFDLLSDPARLPDYVPAIRLEDSTAVEGDLDADATIAERDGAPDAGFLADRGTRRIEWGRPGAAYGGSIAIAAGTSSTSSLTLRLRTRDDVDVDQVDRMVDLAVAGIRRLLLPR